MSKGGGQPALRLVADTAILSYRDMGSRLHLCINHPCPVMTVGTGSRGALEDALDMATLAGGVVMHPGQRKLGLVVIEVDTGTGTFSRHQ